MQWLPRRRYCDGGFRPPLHIGVVTVRSALSALAHKDVGQAPLGARARHRLQSQECLRNAQAARRP
eukprot:3675229-Pyramimonas_sp.AAC.1